MFESATAAPRFKARFPIKLPSFSFRGGGLVGLLLKALLVVSPFLFLRACVITYVPPDQIGLRQVSFGPNKGLQNSRWPLITSCWWMTANLRCRCRSCRFSPCCRAPAASPA